MNAEFLEDINFGGLLGDGTAEIGAKARKKRRAVNVLCVFLSACSLLSYGTVVFAFAEEVATGDFLAAAVEAVLYEDTPEALGEGSQVIVRIEETEPSAPTVKEDEEPIEDTAAGYPIASADLSCSDVLALANQTQYDPDMEKLSAKSAASVIDVSVGGDPLVLVIHTHGTEAYTPEGADTYTDGSTFRTDDVAQNMIAVGEKVCEGLEANGIAAIHCAEMFDEESYVDSYKKSAAAVASYLEEYPSIRYVLDVHRDAIFRQDMTLVAPVTEDGTAQVMLVCGTDEMGADFPGWQENLSFALAVQGAAEAAHPGFMRNINLRGASFNQQLADRFLLVEVGSAGNTLAQALEAGYRFGEIFAGVIGGQG